MNKRGLKVIKEVGMKMLNYMDNIVEAVNEFCKSIVYFILDDLEVLTKVLLMLSAPVWFFPYVVLQKIMNRK